MKKITLFACFLALLFVVSCGTKKRDIDFNVDYMYAKALDELNKNKLEAAKPLLIAISQEYPYREEAIEAQVLLAWIYYLQNNYEQTESTLETFLNYYVYNNYTQWAQYFLALVKYEQLDDILRDQSNTLQALERFAAIIRSNKNSIYFKDSKLKIDVLKHHLAAREMNVGRFYSNYGSYIAAVNRYNSVVNNYSDTIFIQEALYRLSETYIVLGFPDLAFKSVSILGYNYADSEWYKDALNLLKKHTQFNSDLKIPRL
jgi:outer membrane protein assembly factor BamD